MRTLLVILIMGVLLNACNAPQPAGEELDKAAVSHAVLIVMTDYENALLQSDFEGITKHYLDDPDFSFFTYGKFQSYDEMIGMLKDYFKNVKYSGDMFIEPSVNVLCEGAAVYSSRMSYTLTDTTGAATAIEGGVTYVLVNRDGQWKIINAIGSFIRNDKEPGE